ncbi:MAG: hypothetical protein P1Q69_09780, partial [Candidatus Thorarchaeota archaeon]|nr:hypothetical protein [Candidatus Thorarchaeota archaeon]
VILAAGMDGVNRKLTPPDPRSEDVFTLSDEEREMLEIRELPSNLGEALDALEKDAVITDALGNEIIAKFISLKRNEWNHYLCEIVTEWEWETYSDL